MSVKVELVFNTVEEAIAALGKVAGIAPASIASVTPPAVEKTPRKGRSDAGQPRGPNARTAGEQNAAGASAGANATATAGNSTTGTTDPSKAPEQGANSTSTTPAAPTAAAPQAPAAVTTAPAAPIPAPAAPIDDATIQAGVEKLFNAKGFDDTALVLSRFGVQRGKDLLPVQRAEFLAKVDAVLAGGAI